MAVDPIIKQKAEDIRHKIYGKEVRESLASGLEAMSDDVVEVTDRQASVEEQFQDVLDETTGKDVISAPEVILARGGAQTLGERLDSEKAEVTAQLQQNEYNMTGYKGSLFDVNKKYGFGKERPYEAWPWSNVFYDAELEKFIVGYQSKNDHAGGGGKFLLRRFDVETGFDSESIIVSDLTNRVNNCIGMCILPSGNYRATLKVAIEGADDTEKVLLLKSENKGLSWDNSTEITLNDSTIKAGDVNECYYHGGRLFINISSATDNAFRVLWTDDDGSTWENTTIDNNTPFTRPIEGKFIKLAGNKMVCIARASQNARFDYLTGRYEKEPALISLSLDKGRTWSPFKITNIDDMTANPMGAVELGNGLVELIWGSRFSADDTEFGGSIYKCLATFEDLEKGYFKNVRRIMGGGATNNDFGYVGCASDGNNTLVAYYNRQSYGTNILAFLGKTLASGRVEMVGLSNSNTNDVSYDSERLNVDFEESLNMGIGKTSGLKLSAASLNMPLATRMLISTETINLNNVDFLNVVVRHETDGENNEFGGGLYTEKPTTNAIDNRIYSRFVKGNGVAMVTFDTRDIFGDLYLAVSISARTKLNGGVSFSELEILEIKTGAGDNNILVEIEKEKEYLLNRGDECYRLTNGYDSLLTGTKENVIGKTVVNTNGATLLLTNNKIDVSDFFRLKVRFKNQSTSLTNLSVGLAIYTNKPTTLGESREKAVFIDNLTTEEELTLFLREITGQYYVGVIVNNKALNGDFILDLYEIEII